MNKAKVKFVFSLFIHLFLQVIFSKINLFGFISPAGLSFAFMKLYFGSNIFAVVAFYFISRIWTFSNFNWIFITAYEIVFLALYYFANEFIKTNKKLFLAGVFLAISNVLNLYFCIDKFDFLIQFFINFILEIILFLYFYKFQKVYKNKLVFYKFSRNDYFIFSVMVLLLSLGVFSFEFIEKYLSLFVVIFVIILLGKILPIDRFFIGVTVLLVGTVVATSDFFLFQIGMIFVCFVALFKDFNKWIFLGFVSIILLILLIVFKTLDILSIILVFFAVFIYIFVPNKIFVKISDCFEADGSSIILQTAQNQMICELKSKLIIMS